MRLVKINEAKAASIYYAVWKGGSAQMSVFSPHTLAASVASMEARLGNWAKGNGGTFPSDVVVAVRFGDECFNVTGWLDGPAASYPIYGYSDSGLAAFRRLAPKGLEPPRTWGFPEVYGADAYDGRRAAVYVEAAKRFRPHPAIWGIDIGDEPHGMDLPNVGKAVEMCRRLFPAPFLYVNLFPSYARVATNSADLVNSQLGSVSYRDYIEDYCRYVPLDYISFDIYPYAQAMPKGVGNFFNDLKTVADACVNHGKALWLVGQANTWFKRDPLAENKMRYQAYVGLAFGAEVMTWACWTPGWWTNNVYSATGERTVAYDRVKRVNGELHLLGDACLKYRRVATHFVGYTGKFEVYLKGCEGVSEPSVSTGWFREVAAADGEPLLVAEMVPRDAHAPGVQALFVMASEDPYDENEKERVIRFRPLRRTVEALGVEGPIHVGRDAEGFSTVTLRSNRAALIWTK